MHALAEPVDIGTLITYQPLSDGERRACLKGSGMSVKCIVNWYKMGCSPEEILVKYDHLSMQEIYAALAYYYARSRRNRNGHSC